MKGLDLNVRVEVDAETRRTLAVYIQVRKGRAAEVKELANGKAFANFDRVGRLLGVEVLAPCSLAVFDQVTEEEPREVKEYIRNKLPAELAIGA